MLGTIGVKGLSKHREDQNASINNKHTAAIQHNQLALFRPAVRG